ncbi:MAG: FUSC family protein [Leucobacter sp.]
MLLLLLVAVIGAPAIVLATTPLASGIMFVFAGNVPGILASLYTRGVAVWAVAGTTVLVLLVEIAKPYPWAATVLMIMTGLVVGVCARYGWHTIAAIACAWPVTFLIGPASTAPEALSTTTGLAPILIPALLTLVGGAWAILVGSVLSRRVPRSEPMPQPRTAAIAYGAALALLLGVSTFIAATWLTGTMAGWLLLTIFMVVRPELADTRHRIVNRSAGTILGGLAAALLAYLVPIHGLLLAIGLLAVAATVAFQILKVNYAAYAFVLTLAVVLLNTPGTNVLAIDLQRIAFTVIGTLAISALVLIAEPLLRARRPSAATDRSDASR